MGRTNNGLVLEQRDMSTEPITILFWIPKIKRPGAKQCIALVLVKLIWRENRLHCMIILAFRWSTWKQGLEKLNSDRGGGGG